MISHKKILLLISTFLLSVNMLTPFNIYSETQTYFNPEYINYDNKNGYFVENGNDFLLVGSQSLNDPKVSFFKDTSNRYYFVVTSVDSLSAYNQLYEYYNNHGYQHSGGSQYRRSLNNTYYYGRWWSLSYEPATYISLNVSFNSDGNTALDRILPYIYGDLAVDPSDLPNYGQLKVGYSSSFVSSRDDDTWRFNKDTITWDSTDTNGNFIGDSNIFVNIRAIPGYYEGPDKAAVLLQTYNNWVDGVYLYLTQGALNIGRLQFYDLVSQNANSGSYETTWGNVVDHLPSGALIKNGTALGQYLDNRYYQMGWRYQINFEVHDREDFETIVYTSPWQDIFQVTAVDPSTSNQIIETYPDGLSPELYNLLQTVNTLNNTVQNWNINGIPVNMQPNQQITSDNSWVEKLLESITSIVAGIVDSIRDIISAIAGVASDLISGLFDLVSDLGINIIQFFSDLIDDITGYFQSIDLSLPQFELPEIEELGELVNIPTYIINKYISSGLGFIIFIPLIIWLIGVII